MTETLKDVTIRYLFVKAFEWVDVALKERYQGHPKPETVYRSFFNETTGNYKIFVGNIVFIADKLNTTEEDGQARTSTIEVITKGNILELNLPEAELDSIIAWEASSNKDIKTIYEAPPPIHVSNGLVSLKAAMGDQEAREAADMDIAMEVLQELYMINTSLFHLIVETASALVHHDLQLHQNGAMMTLELSDHGAGYNIGTAMKKLNRYLSKPKRGGDDREDIMDAIVTLYTELDRRNLLSLDED